MTHVIETGRPGWLGLHWAPRLINAKPGNADGKGRGLFAVAAIAKGELIDLACTVPLTPEQCLKLDKMLPFGDFYFAHPEDPTAGLVILGMASLCNHADRPNAHVDYQWEPDFGWVATLTALADIAAGEEITYHYRCAIWFERDD